jgi:hypothetical protein
MTAGSSVDPVQWLTEQVGSAEPDLVRSMVATFAQALMSAEADAVCGAPYGQPSPDRVNRRNGYRAREWDTRAATIELAIPKLPAGSYFPEWLLERCRRAEQALISVVATSYLLGVSTRRVEKLVEQLGVKGLSRSQVSAMAAHLDEQVAQFRSRPLDAGPYTFVSADALTVKVREGGRTVNVHALLAVEVKADGYREILGLDVTSAEDGAGWVAFFRGLLARGLAGVGLVTSDAHAGLVAAIGATLPGASWQRCRTHWICKETTCCFRPGRWMMRYGRRGGGPRPARQAVRGSAAAPERASAAARAGDRGSAAGAWRRAGGGCGGQRQRYHGAQGCGRARGRGGSISGRPRSSCRWGAQAGLGAGSGADSGVVGAGGTGGAGRSDVTAAVDDEVAAALG